MKSDVFKIDWKRRIEHKALLQTSNTDMVTYVRLQVKKLVMIKLYCYFHYRVVF